MPRGVSGEHRLARLEIDDSEEKPVPARRIHCRVERIIPRVRNRAAM